MVRESTLSLLQYVTAMILIIVLTVHVLTHIPGIMYSSYHESLEPNNVYRNYRIIGGVLAILLPVAAIHGLNGLRGILLELKQGRAWELLVNIVMVILGVYAIGLGMITLLRWLGILYWVG